MHFNFIQLDKTPSELAAEMLGMSHSEKVAVMNQLTSHINRATAGVIISHDKDHGQNAKVTLDSNHTYSSVVKTCEDW